ncbi:EpsG family protein [Rheinheimera salexigens]|uniref:EpsG family protein n=1 Tax=Rheinheimera salexigens TaxID=1628148 RepID=A0A1E7Q4Z1_9GAMM|nr:EpsG family protein [Rheinheimera salexigens]OEY69217.1 hypothetical protein BI198_06255 [Rheinheimera salexigens]
MGFLTVSLFFVTNGALCLVEYLTRNNNFKKLLFFLVVLSFSTVFSLRDGVILSTDYKNYVLMFDSFPSNFQAAILRVEPLFGASIFIAKKIGLSANDFISLVSFIFHFSLAFFVLRILRFPLILFLLLTTTSFYFNFASNTIRQGLAMSFFMFGLVQKKIKKEIVFYLLSFLTHYSSIILIFYIFIFKNFNFIRNKLLLVFLLAFSVLCFFFRSQVCMALYWDGSIKS